MYIIPSIYIFCVCLFHHVLGTIVNANFAHVSRLLCNNAFTLTTPPVPFKYMHCNPIKLLPTIVSKNDNLFDDCRMTDI